MRRLLAVAVAALAVTACGRSDDRSHDLNVELARQTACVRDAGSVCED